MNDLTVREESAEAHDVDMLVIVGLRGIVLDVQDAHREGVALPYGEIQKAADILNGVCESARVSS